MLNFIFWGITLNCYAFTILVLAAGRMRPKSKHARLHIAMGILIPYFLLVSTIVIFLIWAFCGFDIGKVEEKLEKRL